MDSARLKDSSQLMWLDVIESILKKMKVRSLNSLRTHAIK